MAILPVVALAFVPSLDSPFLAAKTGVLLLAGALAAVFLAAGESTVSGRAASAINLVRLAAIAWCALICASLLTARHWDDAWPAIAPIAATACIFLALLRVRVPAPKLFAGIAIAAVCVALLALGGRAGFDLPRILAGAPAPGRMRAAATLGNPLFVASFLAASFWSIPGLDRLRRIWRFVAMAIVLTGMAATAERTVALAFGVGAVVYIASGAAGGVRRRALHAIAILLVCGLLFGAARAGNPRSFDTAFRGRIFLWTTALRHVTLLGEGPGSFYRMYSENLLAEAQAIPQTSFHFVRYETDAHSIAVHSLAETGVAGFVALAAAFALWFRMAWARRHTIAVRCALAGVNAFFAAGLVDNPLARPEGLTLLAFWLAVPWLFADAGDAQVSEAPIRRASHRGLLPRIAAPACVALAIVLVAAAGATLYASYAVAAGVAAEGHADWAAAERWDRAALRVNPASRDAHFNLVRVLCQSGRFDACLDESDRALSWVNEAELHLIRVRALEMLGRDAAAREELLDARAQFPWSAELQQEQIEEWTEPPTTPPVVVELNSVRSAP
ncbi:MAG: hypothetical protein ABSA32_11785 [Candidatus Acidiferrales bacterium]